MARKSAEEYNRELLAFICAHPTSFHVVDGQKKRLEAAGYACLSESGVWDIRPGGKYFVTRGGSAIAAFRVPEGPFAGFMIMASHADSPALKVKTSPEIKADGACTKLNVEPYGGLLMAPWFDRPLSAAGRLYVRTAHGAVCRLVNLDRDLVVIPSLAIHMNREANKGYAYNAQKDLLPLYGMDGCRPLMELAAEAAGVKKEDILDAELSLYNRQAGFVFGAEHEFLGSPRLDDVQCAFASLEGFLQSEAAAEASDADAAIRSVPVHVVFDNEEVGSSTRQGAASTFLADTLERISEALGENRSDYRRHIAQSFMLSADNAHAVHPNHPDKADPVNRPKLNGGVVLKYSANKKYTTDAESAAIVRLLAERAGITLQEFHNRSDVPGGSTLGNISGNQAAVCTADVGIAQLAMHAPCEVCGAEDTVRMIKLAAALFASGLRTDGDGGFALMSL